MSSSQVLQRQFKFCLLLSLVSLTYLFLKCSCYEFISRDHLAISKETTFPCLLILCQHLTETTVRNDDSPACANFIQYSACGTDTLCLNAIALNTCWKVPVLNFEHACAYNFVLFNAILCTHRFNLFQQFVANVWSLVFYLPVIGILEFLEVGLSVNIRKKLIRSFHRRSKRRGDVTHRPSVFSTLRHDDEVQTAKLGMFFQQVEGCLHRSPHR